MRYLFLCCTLALVGCGTLHVEETQQYQEKVAAETDDEIQRTVPHCSSQAECDALWDSAKRWGASHPSNLGFTLGKKGGIEQMRLVLYHNDRRFLMLVERHTDHLAADVSCMSLSCGPNASNQLHLDFHRAMKSAASAED